MLHDILCTYPLIILKFCFQMFYYDNFLRYLMLGMLSLEFYVLKLSFQICDFILKLLAQNFKRKTSKRLVTWQLIKQAFLTPDNIKPWMKIFGHLGSSLMEKLLLGGKVKQLEGYLQFSVQETM